MTETTSSHSKVVAFVSFVFVSAIVAGWLIVQVDRSYGTANVNWIAFGLLSMLLFIGETRSELSMRFGEGGEVTPGWAFAYALALLGSPTGAVVAMVVTNLYVDVRHHKGALKTIFNVSQIALSLSVGGLMLHAFGIHGGIAATGNVALRAGVGIILGGAAVFVVNGLLTATVIGLHQGVGFRRTIEAGFALSMTADGALLALAPIFVIAIEYSIVLIPLMLTTSFLVYQSARNAISRAHEATHDPLTGLLNRRAFEERVEVELADPSSTGLVVLLMDLDRFKDVNDRLGHQIGDLLLVSFAHRLQRVLPDNASASRLGGDEFAIVIPGLIEHEAVKAATSKLHEQLSAQHDIDGFPLSVGVSIGVATGPLHGSTCEILTAAADVAMYRAKRLETGVEFAATLEGEHKSGRIGLLVDLSSAVTGAQINAHYQPLVRLGDGVVDTVEALMRWEHPVHGPIPPSEFIGLAEQTDLIGPLTEAMLRTAMTDMMTMGDNMPRLAVNVAARSMLDRQFAGAVLSIVNDVGFPPEMLEIEITERAIVTGSERSALTIEQLRARGIRIAIDDFGTGYSSFLTLRDLRADRLKIDRQFTANLLSSQADQLIVTKVIELAHGLGLDVVAEGVESEAVWNRLGTLGCDVAQGYAIARPMSMGDFADWTRKRNAMSSEKLIA
jgi:diguanylate cyclase